MNINDIKKIKERNLDFPIFVKELMKLDIISYEVNYKTNETIYQNSKHETLAQKNRHLPIFNINGEWNETLLQEAILNNKNKQTTYREFSKNLTFAGVESYKVDFINKVCIYYNINKTKKLNEELSFLQI